MYFRGEKDIMLISDVIFPPKNFAQFKELTVKRLLDYGKQELGDQFMKYLPELSDPYKCDRFF